MAAWHPPHAAMVAEQMFRATPGQPQWVPAILATNFAAETGIVDNEMSPDSPSLSCLGAEPLGLNGKIKSTRSIGKSDR